MKTKALLPITAILALALLAGVTTRIPGRSHAAGGTLVIFNGMVVDGTGGGPIENGTVVIDGDRIVAVGHARDVTVPPDALKLDARGGTIMPGVIDPHTHIGDTLWRQIDILSPWLLTGVTSVQDLGTLWPLIPLYRERAATLPSPPRMQFGGPIISPTGGYPADEWSYKYGVDTVDEARAFVKRLIEETHVDVIKIAIERGYSIDYDEPGLPVLSPVQVAAICDEAHAHGKIVIAHATDPKEVEIGIDNGVDVLAHSPVSPISDTVLRRAIAKGVPMITTIGAWGDVQDRPHYALKNALRYWELGGKIITATDYPFQPAEMPLREFQLLSEGGVPNEDIIVAATGNAALALDRDDLGTLEEGKLGDVIVVAGDPLENIQAMADVEAVVLGGRVVKGSVEGATPTPSPATATPQPLATAAPSLELSPPIVGSGQDSAGVPRGTAVAAIVAAAMILATSLTLGLRSLRR